MNTIRLSLKEKINIKKTNLNSSIDKGIKTDILRLSHELDDLITEYAKLQLKNTKE